ncbi:MAG: gamma-glutamyltransferase, partial [Candidatus Riflebacteria bacterium]|nr:gamma-glutamyltransferase [Candidatus Riflebacteria bacterium]
MRKTTYLFRILFYFFYVGFLLFYSNCSFAYERIYYSEGMNGAVSCGHPLAARTAIKILKEDGNAVDAAVAAAFVLGVVDFSNSGIGGEGFALIYHPSNKIIAIDGSTKRPANDIRNEYDCAIALPAIPEMLLKMRRLYGTQSAKKLMTPAIEICNKGFEVS